MAMKDHTRVAKGPLFTPSPSDVENLLAAIAKIENKEQTQATARHLTPKDGNLADFFPTRRDWRLAKTLDSLANLCVSKLDHEVIATALRVHYKARLIELIIASNNDVQSSTVAHLQEIWNNLQHISTLSSTLRSVDPDDSSSASSEDAMPSNSFNDGQVSSRLGKFIQLCLEFSFSRLQARTNKDFQRFMAINVNNSNPKHPFRTVQG
jgi:hypothetical protein